MIQTGKISEPLGLYLLFWSLEHSNLDIVSDFLNPKKCKRQNLNKR